MVSFFFKVRFFKSWFLVMLFIGEIKVFFEVVV